MNNLRNVREDWSEADPPETTLDGKLVKWIPIVVPLMALFLAVMVLFIVADVL
jgi:type II secretory pathway component PulF